MSKRNGDKARFNRLRKARLRVREVSRAAARAVPAAKKATRRAKKKKEGVPA